MNEQIPTITLPSGKILPALGLGTWMMGESSAAASDEMETIKAALDLGMAVIDTAEIYADGGSERIVGKAIKGRRDDVFVVSKVAPWNASQAGTIAACEASLERLGIECIDLYLLHWRGEYPLRETIAAFETLKRHGKIGAWGVSNFDVTDIEELWAVENGSQCQVNQILYNLSRRGVEFDLLPWCQAHGVTTMAYSPIEQGRLVKHPELIAVAKANQATPAQIALAFLLERENVMPIPKTRSISRLQENLTCIDIDLSDDDLQRLDAAFPPPEDKVQLQML